MEAKDFSDFVFGNYPLQRIEEFRNGTAALLGFNNFAESLKLSQAEILNVLATQLHHLIFTQKHLTESSVMECT